MVEIVLSTGFRTVVFFILMMLLLAPLEQLFPLHHLQRVIRKGSSTDLTYLFVNPVLINCSAAFAFAFFAATTERFSPVALREMLASLPWLLQFIIVLLLSELALYWAHRLSHEVPVLWRFHSVHHSVEEMDWLAAHRQHPAEAIMLAGIANLPGMMLGFSLSVLAGFVLFQKIYSAFLHANVRISFGPLNRLIASPVFHRWHHERRKECHNTNYASLFSLFDWIFGTYRVPQDELPESYGI